MPQCAKVCVADEYVLQHVLQYIYLVPGMSKKTFTYSIQQNESKGAYASKETLESDQSVTKDV